MLKLINILFLLFLTFGCASNNVKENNYSSNYNLQIIHKLQINIDKYKLKLKLI